MQGLNVVQGPRFPAAIAMRSPADSAPHAEGARRFFHRGDEIFAEGDSSDYFYKVVSGTARTSKLLVDGRRQIDAFHLAGDVFGLESSDHHRFTAEAVDDVEVIAYRRASFSALAQKDPSFGEQLMSSMLTSLDRAHDHMVLLGRKTALEKMASFLLDLARRAATGDRVELSIQRTDIADHLGLTIETVSRILSQMTRTKLIRLTEAGRTVVLTDRAGLQLLQA